jgi:hypothetical protein
VRGQVELGPRRDLVPEQSRLLVRIAGAADGAEQRSVVDNAPGGRVQAGPFGQPGSEQAGAQTVLERHAGRQVRGQADRGDQRGQLDAVTRALHPQTLPQVSRPLRDKAAARPVRDKNGREITGATQVYLHLAPRASRSTHIHPRPARPAHRINRHDVTS